MRQPIPRPRPVMQPPEQPLDPLQMLLARLPEQAPNLPRYERPKGKDLLFSTPFAQALLGFAATDTRGDSLAGGLASALGNSGMMMQRGFNQERGQFNQDRAAALQQMQANAAVLQGKIAALQGQRGLKMREDSTEFNQERALEDSARADEMLRLRRMESARDAALNAARISAINDEAGPGYKVEERDGVYYRVFPDGREEPHRLPHQQGDDPERPVGKQEFDRAGKLTATFMKEVDEIKDVPLHVQNILTAAYFGNPNNIDDLQLVVSFFKMMDPRSIVTEGESVQVQQTPSISDRAMGWFRAAQDGGALPPSTRAAIAQAAVDRYNDAATTYNEKVDNLYQKAETFGVRRAAVEQGRWQTGEELAADYRQRGKGTRTEPYAPPLETVGRPPPAGETITGQEDALRQRLLQGTGGGAPGSKVLNLIRTISPEEAARRYTGKARAQALATFDQVANDESAPLDARDKARLLAEALRNG